MLFNSFVFIFAFLPLALAAAFAVSRWRAAGMKLALVILSLAFYAWAGPRQLPLLVASLAFNFAVGELIRRALKAGRSGTVAALLAVGVAADVALLVWFKYARFAAVNLDSAFGLGIPAPHVVFLLAISFFTFQEIAYLVDTARGETTRTGALDFALFFTFFPKLIAGPIVRWREMVPQQQGRRFGALHGRDLMVGLVMFAMGLFKKTVIADTLSPYVNQLFTAAAGHGDPTFAAAWLAAIAFTFQVYFDFSGYSDMAIGLGRMFGLKLPLNFHSPFRAPSIIDYWRRWHMTLQRFVVTYIFQPLSLPLNRMAARRGLAVWPAFFLAIGAPIFLTFVVLGVWHGAGWTFAVFGVMHGVYVVVNEAWRERGKRVRRKRRRGGLATPAPGRAERFGYHALTLLAVIVANVMFRCLTVGDAVSMWKGMAGLAGFAGPVPGLDWGLAAALALSVVLVFFLPNTQQIMGAWDPAFNWREWKTAAPPPIAWRWKPSAAGIVFAGAALFFGVMFIQSGQAVFLYFNF
ncbi:MAG: MBOAT family O-acyltransferase [Caulobacteraceae bacterium]